MAALSWVYSAVRQGQRLLGKSAAAVPRPLELQVDGHGNVIGGTMVSAGEGVVPV